ncbi:T9SS type B sorting domain-containing protein [Flavobacterium sp. Fl-77]|uniref:T9SS type B sorting domain-containing protein n=1 Tax=Flavobacterium flavipigmentatum TaxID=2893884 RepID=A0AAJ2SI53_9FLAO|nr:MULTISPECIES: T9SS type B sorting domain-containing protein [unclassified Flavobacterium]MDX6183355.1 T9SS type B sorting domain-containing protein [Flavobacterium sp. Fl-33]MDX6186639.1 T9SS type B sorting domain-containing protein [Flavobacterium sp. Fl-77]UFH38592.1 T9SS type B sorting domain-containing protein [Flavobacterium sp. F-70]
MRKKLLLLILLIIVPFLGFSQFSKTHYIPPVVASAKVPVGSQFIYISTPSTIPVNFNLKEIGGAVFSGTVSRDNPYIFDINAHNANQFVLDEYEVSRIKSNSGYIIEAADVVYATVRVIDRTGNQSSEIVSKGLAALGTQFRISGLTNKFNPGYSDRHLTFASILATENNTVINFTDIKPGSVLINNFVSGNSLPSITLNSGESYTIAVQGPTPANNDALIGALIASNKPIAVNCGSFAGSNGSLPNNIDLGFDQIVSAERTGKDYIFIKSTGSDEVEKVILIAHENNTEIFLNGSLTPNYTINAGEYVAVLGNNYNAEGNLYVHSNKNIFAYQSVGDNSRPDEANQEMFFVPPLSCQTPQTIDNIPAIEAIGNRYFTGRVTLTTKTGSNLNFIIDATPYTLATLPPFVNVLGPTAVTGNPDYQCYVITGLTGNVSVFSTSELYLAAYGSDGAATFGGYYSGFTFKPEVNFQQLNVTQSGCIPNIKLNISSLTGFDTFQWYFNDVAISGANSNSYSPTQPGYYKVKATLSACGIDLFSDEIPVSDCPTDLDNDKTNDNIDLDNDADGITNCTESFGNQNINIDATSNGIISVGTYNNSFITKVTTSTSASTTPFTGSIDGSFVTEVPPGKTNWVTYTLNFTQPISLGLEYISTANTGDLLNSGAEYVVNSEINKTITVLNPDNQLLIDTNYDGFYESGITEYSSFEIRFRLNNTVPLAAGTGTFKFLTNQSKMISLKHKNLSDVLPNKTSLKFYAVCVSKDTDNDGVPDQWDLDSDNDGIPDSIEAQGTTIKTISTIDANHDGIDDAFANGITPADFDNDNVMNYLDLDSDNDGIYDLKESGSNALDTNLDGIIDGNNFGPNGLANTVETVAESGKLNYTVADTDSDGIYNYTSLDSDNDLCSDVIEAGFTDGNNDRILGAISPPTVNANGVVTSGAGYTNPNTNYTIAAPIIINNQPENKSVCELQSTTFAVTSAFITSYQWQISTNNGATWTDLSNNTTYSGVTASTLVVSNVTLLMHKYQYRVYLNRTGNSCGLYSANATVSILALPSVASSVTLVQCDDDTDGVTAFNLTQKNNIISANSAQETISYYATLAGAETENPNLLIATPLAYKSSNKIIYARVANANGCFRVSQLNLVVAVTQLPGNFQIPDYQQCDDFIDVLNNDTDGVTSFNFSNATQEIKNRLPAPATNYTVSYYKNEADFLAETDASGNSLAITAISNYRNIGYPNNQKIWARVENTLSNDCYGFITFNLIVNPLPEVRLNADGAENELICSNIPEFLITIDAGITTPSTVNDYTYQWFLNGNLLSGATTFSIEVSTQGIYTVVVKNTSNCSRTRTVKVTASDIAKIQAIEVEDLSDNNSVLVKATGAGNYVYSITDANGPYQESNLFENVPIGFHTVYVKDLNDCGISEKLIAVLGAPKFFTPNADGYNDTWNVKGADADFYTNSIIYIFDRYGKLIKQLSPLSEGWNGTFNGSPLPADDYWYAAKFEDGREAKGHFSLKR